MFLVRILMWKNSLEFLAIFWCNDSCENQHVNAMCLSSVIFHEKIYVWILHIFLVRSFTCKKSQEFHVILLEGIFTWKITCKCHALFRCFISQENKLVDGTCFLSEDTYVKKFTRDSCDFWCVIFTWK